MNERAGTLKLIENIKISRIEKLTGRIIDTEEKTNLITNAGKVLVAKLLGNVDSVAYYRAIAIGTGTTAAAAGDTTLETENSRSAVTATYEANYKCVFDHTFTFGSAYAITEAGVFDSATASGSTILNRSVFSAKNVSDVIDLRVTITITVA